ncbi:hypothetical protein Y032_0058g2841 [Ancylostoma ceylanicum]|uniref:Secreted protein n=1 Tax=Ancylostoma ceylanicum TaxID=53326 RepID=A0A016U5D2_9BILA|nr:hypothetical protein Y032_0058g2841 [Ancylostoma ceylanicum]
MCNSLTTLTFLRYALVHVLVPLLAYAMTDYTETNGDSVLKKTNVTIWRLLLFHQKPNDDRSFHLSIHNFTT